MMRRLFKSFGEHLVADPRVCHGKWTFRGTRIFVSDVLDQLAEGMAWKEISRQWRGDVSFKAISEAILLARHALLKENAELREYPARPDEITRVVRIRKTSDAVARAKKRTTGEAPVVRGKRR